MIRLFVALALPAPVRASLAAWAAQAAPQAMRRLPQDDLHLTLAFLGARAPADAGVVGDLLGELARPVGELAVEGAIWLAPRGPRVLAVALRAQPALGELHAELVAALAGAIGFAPERRALRPHVTVARARRAAPLRAQPLVPAPPALVFAPAALVLYRSHTGPGGSRYEALARSPVGAAARG